MKISLLVCVYLSMAAVCLGQCSSVISRTDTIGSVKSKMSCWAKLESDAAAKNAALQAQLNTLKDENKKLLDQIAELRAENTKLKDNPPLSLSWTGRTFDPSKFSIAECKSNAADAMAQRGGIPTGDGTTWIGFMIGNELVTVNCQTSETGFVFVVRPTVEPDFTLGTLLANKIFP